LGVVGLSLQLPVLVSWRGKETSRTQGEERIYCSSPNYSPRRIIDADIEDPTTGKDHLTTVAPQINQVFSPLSRRLLARERLHRPEGDKGRYVAMDKLRTPSCSLKVPYSKIIARFSLVSLRCADSVRRQRAHPGSRYNLGEAVDRIRRETLCSSFCLVCFTVRCLGDVRQEKGPVAKGGIRDGVGSHTS